MSSSRERYRTRMSTATTAPPGQRSVPVISPGDAPSPPGQRPVPVVSPVDAPSPPGQRSVPVVSPVDAPTPPGQRSVPVVSTTDAATPPEQNPAPPSTSSDPRPPGGTVEVSTAVLKAEIIAKDRIIAQNDEIIAQNDEIIAQKDKIIAHNDEIIAQKDTIIAQNDEIIAQMGKVKNDTSVSRLKDEEKFQEIYISVTSENSSSVELSMRVRGLCAKKGVSKFMNKIQGKPKPSHPDDMVTNAKFNKYNVTEQSLDLDITVENENEQPTRFAVYVKKFPCLLDTDSIQLSVKQPPFKNYSFIFLRALKKQPVADWKRCLEVNGTLECTSDDEEAKKTP